VQSKHKKGCFKYEPFTCFTIVMIITLNVMIFDLYMYRQCKQTFSQVQTEGRPDFIARKRRVERVGLILLRGSVWLRGCARFYCEEA
jgi:hypothetical protein